MTAPIRDGREVSQEPPPRASDVVDAGIDNAAMRPAGRDFFRQFRQSAKKTLQSAVTPDTFDYMRDFYRRSRLFYHRSRRVIETKRRISFPLLHAEDYKLARQGHDVVFLLHAPQIWPNVKLVVDELKSRRPDLRLAVTFPGARDKLPNSLTIQDITVIANFTEYLSYSLVTKILYTPHPSLDEFLSSLHRPPGATLICAPYSLNTIDGTFTEDGFDMYDYILCQGPEHIESFRRLALKRPALSGKKLLPAGYPKLDLMLALGKQRPRPQSTKITVVYAPTHLYWANRNLTSLVHYGEAIVDALLTEGYHVIFRPHGASLNLNDIVERPVVERIRRSHTDNPNFSFDSRADYTDSYSRADLMVTDVSGTGFTYSFGFGKPAIFFAPNANAEQGLSGIQFEGRDRIGALVRNIDELIRKTTELRHRNMAAEIERFRSEAVYNVGDSAAYIATCLEDILSGHERPEMIQL